MGEPSFLTELKRRNVIRMAGLYLVGAWLIVQVAGTVLPMFGAPAWMPRSWCCCWRSASCRRWFRLGVRADARWHQARRRGAAGSIDRPQTARRMEHMIVVLLLSRWATSRSTSSCWRRSGRRRRSRRALRTAGRAAAKAAHAKSIAVLPFENLSEDKANGFFADGIQDQILTGLAKIGDLKVISRTSTQKYASRPENLSQIARELGVEHILEGSVQRAGNQVRINVQLIEAGTDSHLWAETYDRSLDDVFAVEKRSRAEDRRIAGGQPQPRRAGRADAEADRGAGRLRGLPQGACLQRQRGADPPAGRPHPRRPTARPCAWIRSSPWPGRRWPPTCSARPGSASIRPAAAGRGHAALARSTRAGAGLCRRPRLARGVHMYYVERDFPARWR
jgi:TolB-like protein